MRPILTLLAAALFFLAAPAQAINMELYSGDTFQYAETSEDETFVYADLTSGAEYMLVTFFDGCCNIDTLVVLIEPESLDLFSSSIESGENVYTTTLATGETVYIVSFEGVLYTEGQIGVMADRIGEMADRIVYTEELIYQTETLIVDVTRFSQANLLTFVDMLNPLKLLQ